MKVVIPLDLSGVTSSEKRRGTLCQKDGRWIRDNRF